MNDDLEAQFRQIDEEMDYFENPPLAFPKLGGAYDTYSLLIFTKIQGSGTYKNRLYKFASKLATDFLNQNETSRVIARIPHAELIKQLEYILHSIAHIASGPVALLCRPKGYAPALFPKRPDVRQYGYMYLGCATHGV